MPLTGKPTMLRGGKPRNLAAFAGVTLKAFRRAAELNNWQRALRRS